MQRDKENRDVMTPPESSPAAKAGACASCKHQRKKCGGGCALAPFFPASEYSCFREVHRLFGVSNVQKLISKLKKENKATETQLREAMDAVKWVARSWDREPFLGCRGEYKRLEVTYSRLRYVIAQCRFCNHSSSATHEKTDQTEKTEQTELGVILLPRPNSPIYRRPVQILLSNGDKDAVVSECYFNGDGILLNVPRGGAPVSYVPGILEAQIGLGPVSHLPPLEKQLISSTQFGFTVANGIHAITNNHSLQGNCRSSWAMNNMIRDQISRETIRIDASSSSERSPACASCKHQRKKCGRDCIMAPFFPAEKDSSFKEVHKLFGVSNIQKMIERLKREKNATEAQVADAIDAVKWVASSWERDPVSGCYGEYKRLEELCLRLQRQVSLCAFCGTAQTQSPLPAPAHHFNGAAINYWRASTNNISPGTHPHQNSSNRFANYNNQAVQISGYLDAAAGGRNLNPEIQVGAVPHPYLPLLDAADHSGLFPPGNNFRLPRTAATSSSPALAAPSATYYHNLQDHQGRNGITETKKAKELDEQVINWGSSSLP